MSIALPTAHRSTHATLAVAWLASIALLLAQVGAIALRAAQPPVGLSREVPEAVLVGRMGEVGHPAGHPLWIRDANAFLVATDEGLLLLDAASTHCLCNLAWNARQFKFIGICHGSQFTRTGEFIQGPAPRSMDRIPLVALDPAGDVLARSRDDGVLPDPFALPLEARLVADTRQRILGAGHRR